MLTHELVPELVLAAPGEYERFLPDAADGEVEVWAGNDGFEAYGYTAGGFYWAHFPGTASFRFLADQGDVVALADAGVPSHRIADTYLRGVLPLVLQLRGHEVLHASAVSTPRGLVILCGVSGTGKSTFAYGLSQRGHAAWADDAVVLDVDDGEATAFQVPFRLGLRTDAATFFGHVPERRAAGDVAPLRASLLALLVLEPQDADSVPLVGVTRLEPTDAFVAVLPNAYYFRLSDQARKAVMLDRYLRLAASVPTFDVSYRPGLGDMSAVLDELERRVLAV